METRLEHRRGWGPSCPAQPANVRCTRHPKLFGAPGLLAFALLLAALPACETETTPIFIARCVNDLSCGGGEVCVDGACLPRDAVSCQSIEGGQAILQPGPVVLDFGHTGSGTSRTDLALRNIGNCTLTVFEAYLEKESASPFQCPFCIGDNFPLELFPFRDAELSLFFTPRDGVGTYEDTLILLSDDAEFTELRIPVRARFNGLPEAAVIPADLDFDYVPVGRTVTRTVEVTNRGTGTAPLRISRIEIETATSSAGAFSFEPPLDNPVELLPRSSGTADSHVVHVRYHPRAVEAHSAQLVLYTNQPRDGVVRVPLIGSSKTPARISVSPPAIQFGPVPIGQTTAQPLTVVNQGGSPLRISYRWGGTGLSTDLSALPQVVQPIPPGQYTELQVLVTATALGPITGLLIIETNDPTRPTVTVPVSADGQPVVGAQVVKIDMNFDNGSDSVFDDDLRNVDMALENPFGLIVNKQLPNPTNWGAFGNPSWFAFGPKEEPERIVLPDAQADGTYRVLLTYMEDCSSLPSRFLAAVLGISVDVLIAYFTGAVIPGVSGGAVANAIESLCFSRSGTSVTVTIYLNGGVVAEVPARLSRKGDYLYAADLVRQGGVFTVRQ